MPPIDDPLSASRSASSPLLSAALSGLLWLSSSCDSADDPGAAPDTGASVVDAATATGDAGGGTGTDASAGTDASTGTDAGEGTDAGSSEDAGVGMMADASMADDASVDMDASAGSDAGSARDAGIMPRDAVCDALPGRAITSSMIVKGLTLEEFTAMCEGLGGFIEIHPHCGGANSCGGISYDSTIQTLTEHTCVGLNTCTGFTCVLP